MTKQPLTPEKRTAHEQWIIKFGCRMEPDLYHRLDLPADALEREIRKAVRNKKQKAAREEQKSGWDRVEEILCDLRLRRLYLRAVASRRRGEDPACAEQKYQQQRKQHEAEERARKEKAQKQRDAILEHAQRCEDPSEAIHRSRFYEERRDFEIALGYAERACELENRAPYTLNRLAALLREFGHVDDASRLARESVQKDDSLDRNAAGWVTLAAAVRGDEGREICDRVLKRNPTDVYALNTAGALAKEAGLDEEAAAYFRRAFALGDGR